MTTAQSNFTPASLIRNGFDWSGKTTRLPFVVVTVALIVLAALIPSTRNFTSSNTFVFVALTMVFPIWLGHTRRRLRDVGWSGWYMWLAILPVIGLILTIVLAFKPGLGLANDTDKGYSRLGFAVALATGALMLSRAFWAPYWIPAGSMKPTLLVGDFVAAVPLSTPKRGDVVVFRHPTREIEWIKRVIGMPGDTVQMRGGQVVLNGTPLRSEPAGLFVEPFGLQGPMRTLARCSNDDADTTGTCRKSRFVETLPGGRRYETLQIGTYQADETGVFEVPQDHYFLMGDNRDNALDSRFGPDRNGPGFVPLENLTGRVSHVIFSSAGSRMMQFWTWRPERFFWGVK